MKISVPFIKPKEKGQHFLALILGNEKATSVIFEKVGSAIKYISSDEELFSNTIEDADSEHFLATLDKVITTAEASLPPSVETHKTIFGLKENWIADNKIKKEYLDKLKKASDELSLDPIGFLVFSESIVNLIQKDEGAPVTAVLTEIGKKHITVSLVKAGKILETKTSEIHESPSYTVDTLLKHFQTPEVMPARIILLDAEGDLTQEFINHQWSKSLPFLHIPQIVDLPRDAGVKAMLLGAATQMGTQLLYNEGTVQEDDDKPTRIEPEDFQGTNIVNPEAPKADIKEESSEEKHSLDYVEHDKSLEFFGFMEDGDIAKTPPPLEVSKANVPDEIIAERISEIPEEVGEKEETPLPVNASKVTEKLKSFLQKLPVYLKRIKINKKLFAVENFANLKNKKLLIIPVAVIILLVLGFLFFTLSNKATVTVFVNPKTDSKTSSVTFSSLSPTDIKGGFIASEFISVSEEGSQTLPATGKKDVGNPAKGTVTIFNNDSQSVSFSSGTKITSSNGLDFTLDKSVNVASSSGDIFSGTKPGTADVAVTAGAIGQDYNLPSGTKFSIGGNSNAAAKNDSAFSGGTKKSVTVVSKDDENKLLESLPKQLEAKAREDIKSKVPTGKTALNDFVDESVDSPSFDKKIDDQASQLTLKGTVNFKAATYNNSDILSLANSLFTSGDAVLSKDNLTVSAKNITVEKNNDVNADLEIKANLLPKLDTQALAKEIAGYTQAKAKNTILNLPQVTQANIIFNPNIPFVTSSLPGDSKNIKINVVSN